MLILSNEEIDRILTMPACMAVLEELYEDFGRDKALFMPRVDNILACGYEGAYYGFKTMGGAWPRYSIMALRINSDIITHPQIGGGLRRVKIPLADGRWVGLVQLFSTETGELLAIFPDGVNQRMRVGATNGLGIKYLAKPDARLAGIIGSGWQAGAQLLALLATRPIKQVKVYSPSKKNRDAFVQEMRAKTNTDITAVDSPEKCAGDVDILMAATSSLASVIEPEWLRKGMHVSCIKAPEVDESVFDRCDRIVVHTKVQAKQAGNILPGTRHIPDTHMAGWWKNEETAPKNHPDLADLASGRITGRENDEQITCFVNNIGLGLQFAALGALILKKAGESGIGEDLPREWFTESVHP
jgi:ornithine cyclodeaminase/alanine dehydrogenase-like protein (mu-crystallin family)